MVEVEIVLVLLPIDRQMGYVDRRISFHLFYAVQGFDSIL